LKTAVRQIYATFRRTEYYLFNLYPQVRPQLPDEITFIHAEELYELYPDLTPKEREDKISEKYGAVFIIGIGADLPDGKPHDKRAPDYDDWTTETENGFKGLNGDIIIWNTVLQCACELTSMGIRVDKEELAHQLEITGENARLELLFHRRLMDGELPPAIGGGIGQSRTAMVYLRKAHIGEIQSAIWPGEMVDHCRKCGIKLM
jgi:aspartate--ammonia ligase